MGSRKNDDGTIKLTGRELLECEAYSEKIARCKLQAEYNALKKQHLSISLQLKLRAMQDEFKLECERLDRHTSEVETEARGSGLEFDQWAQGIEKKYKLPWRFRDGSYDDVTGQLHGPQ